MRARLAWAVGALAVVLAMVLAACHGGAKQQAASPQTGGTLGDAERGKTLFAKRCSGCHALDRNREGPALGGVYGRTAGRAAGFAYSGAVKSSGKVWDETQLDKWLADPDALLPGNAMDFSVADARERADLIAYLRRDSGR